VESSKTLKQNMSLSYETNTATGQFDATNGVLEGLSSANHSSQSEVVCWQELQEGVVRIFHLVRTTALDGKNYAKREPICSDFSYAVEFQQLGRGAGL
jgi:hypothetical protein